MQMKLKRCGLWLLLAGSLLVLAGNVMASCQLGIEVDGGPVSFTVRGFTDLDGPGEQVPTHWLTFTRTAEDDDTVLYYSLIDLTEGFPRDMVVVQTPYDSDWQAFTEGSDRWRWSSDAQICFLAAGDKQSHVQIGLRGNVKLRAGTYSGTLSASHGPDIPVEITVLPYTLVTTSPQEIQLTLEQGPGWYTIPPLEIQVEANHGDWVLAIASDGLHYQGDKYENVPPLELYLVKPVDEPEKLVPLSEGPQEITRSVYGWGTTLSIDLQTESTWKHPAGVYKGTVFVYVVW
ncbi:MAG TPA: hypothetical protein PLM25_10210 [Limnochordia bacterium]|nr:hypothetical protein [Limnochordia bacterium]